MKVLEPGHDIALALDPAATSFWKNDRYELTNSKGGVISREKLLQLYRRLVDTYAIVSIEDGFAEDDWEGFHAQTELLGDRVQSVATGRQISKSKILLGFRTWWVHHGPVTTMFWVATAAFSSARPVPMTLRMSSRGTLIGMNVPT